MMALMDTTPAEAPPAALSGLFADPALVRFDGTFYLYPTTDGTDGWSATGFEAFSSDDLVTWRPEGEIFSVARGTVWAEGHAWAPAVAERNGRYYLYFSAENNIGVAVAESPTGPFVDSGRPLVARGEYDGVAIDPSVFVDDDGTAYLLWGNTVAHLVVLNEDMVSFDPATETAWRPNGFREAPSLHRSGDVYVLSWSENDTREADYRIRYATSPSVRGPWTDRGVLLQKDARRGILATGHHSVLRLSDEEWAIAYHRFAIPDGSGYRREIALDVFRHAPDGTIAEIVPGSTRLPALGPTAS